jgi:hypothetical protein
MALSMDEQRMLAEIERRLAAEDPGLAARMSSFRRPGPGHIFRSARARVIGSLLTVVVVAMVSLLVYAMLPFRSNTARTLGSHPVASRGLPVMTVSGTGTAKAGTASIKPASAASAASATAAKTGATAKAATAPTTAQHQAPAAARPSSTGRTSGSGSAHSALTTHGP